jgi:hypothetical protein
MVILILFIYLITYLSKPRPEVAQLSLSNFGAVGDASVPVHCKRAPTAHGRA